MASIKTWPTQWIYLIFPFFGVLDLHKCFLCTLQFIWESDQFLCICYYYFIFTGVFFWHSFWASCFSLGLCFDLAHYVLFLFLAKVCKLILRPPPLTDEEHRGETKRRSCTAKVRRCCTCASQTAAVNATVLFTRTCTCTSLTQEPLRSSL